MITIDWRDLLAFFGIFLIAVGAYLVSKPLVLIVLGIVLVAFAFIYQSGGEKDGINNQSQEALDGAGRGDIA